LVADTVGLTQRQKRDLLFKRHGGLYVAPNKLGAHTASDRVGLTWRQATWASHSIRHGGVDTMSYKGFNWRQIRWASPASDEKVTWSWTRWSSHDVRHRESHTSQTRWSQIALAKMGSYSIRHGGFFVTVRQGGSVLVSDKAGLGNLTRHQTR
jgi:hypothetical protein